MDTVILVLLTAAAILMLRAVIVLDRQVSARRRRDYYADVSVRAAKRNGAALEEDALYIWRLMCAGKAASRRKVVRHGEMTANRWNRASALINHLGLDATVTSYGEGEALIKAYVARMNELKRRGAYVAPVET